MSSRSASIRLPRFTKRVVIRTANPIAVVRTVPIVDRRMIFVSFVTVSNLLLASATAARTRDSYKQLFREWTEDWVEEGREQGIAQGRAEERALLCRQAARKFDAATARRLAAALEDVADAG